MTRLVLKLLFKATLPLVLLVGSLSYGVHLRGGDPFAILRGVGAGVGDRVVALSGSTTDGVRQGIGAVGRTFDGDGEHEGAGRTRVYTWLDEHGVTHFASERPTGTPAQTLSIDPDVNVLAPVRAPEREVRTRRDTGTLAGQAAVGRGAARPSADTDPTDVPAMPGMAGLSGAAPSGVSAEQAARLLKLLQGR